jgi:hypothetical protein
MRSSTLFSLAAAAGTAFACDACNGPLTEVVHERNVRRMQPEASGATTGPKAPLEWGQINFLQTVRTHSYTLTQELSVFLKISKLTSID